MNKIGSALSLHPGPDVMWGAAMGNTYACAIRDAWKFRFPIRRVVSDDPILAVEVVFHA